LHVGYKTNKYREVRCVRYIVFGYLIVTEAQIRLTSIKNGSWYKRFVQYIILYCIIKMYKFYLKYFSIGEHLMEYKGKNYFYGALWLVLP
jgi:hypothetical protein